MSPDFHSIGILTLVCSQDLAPDQANHEEDSQTVDVIDELTDGVFLLHPSTLVSLTSSLTSAHPLVPAAFQCPPYGLILVLTHTTVPGLAQALGQLKTPTPMSFHSCTLRC